MNDLVIRKIAKLEEFITGSGKRISDESISLLIAEYGEIIQEWISKTSSKSGIIEKDIGAISILERQMAAYFNSQNKSPSFATQILSDFDEVVQANKAIQSELYTKVDTDKIRVKLSPQQEFIKDRLLYDLSIGGVKDFVLPLVKKAATDAMVLGLSVKKTEEGLLAVIKDKRIANRAEQIARDGIYSYNGAVNQVIAESYNLDRRYYSGGLVADSRPLCVRCSGKSFTKQELDDIVVAYLSSPSLSAGMYKASANEYIKNLFTFRGGYGCLHTIIPLQ